MAYKRKTWREKLADDKGLPKVGRVEGSMRKTWGAGTMVVPAPLEVDTAIRAIRKGRTATIKDLRATLAQKHGVDICCPITTGIFAWIAAHAAEEDRAAGKKRITPWWRVLKQGGKLNPKFPGGIEEQTKRLQAEGHRVVAGKLAEKAPPAKSSQRIQ
jgi:hypothetical protein